MDSTLLSLSHSTSTSIIQRPVTSSTQPPSMLTYLTPLTSSLTLTLTTQWSLLPTMISPTDQDLSHLPVSPLPTSVSPTYQYLHYLPVSPLPSSVSPKYQDLSYIRGSPLPMSVSTTSKDLPYLPVSLLPTRISATYQDLPYPPVSLLLTRISSSYQDRSYLPRISPTPMRRPDIPIRPLALCPKRVMAPMQVPYTPL